MGSPVVAARPSPTVGVAGKSRRATALPPERRRELIVSTSLPLLLERGPSVTTREIAEAAGIAEGTIFRIFPDKDALIEAVIEKALDTGPLEAALGQIDFALPLEQRLVRAVRLLQERVMGVWQLISIVGVRPRKQPDERPQGLGDLRALGALLDPDRKELRFDPVSNARRLRALTIAVTHPALSAGRPATANEIVSMFLDGVRRPSADARSTKGQGGRTSGSSLSGGRNRPAVAR